MPRLRFVEDRELDAEKRALIASAERTGAPDPRVVRIMVRSSAGLAWVKCWNSVLYDGLLPHKLKEMCRIRISVAHRCGYCSTVRSTMSCSNKFRASMEETRNIITLRNSCCTEERFCVIGLGYTSTIAPTMRWDSAKL